MTIKTLEAVLEELKAKKNILKAWARTK